MSRKSLNVLFPILVVLIMGVACTSEKSSDISMATVREIHDQVLTVDTHCDTPMMMVGGKYDVGERHESGRRSGKS